MVSIKLKLVFILSLFQISACSGTLKKDEHVWFFPVSANQISDTEWNVPIHHWVFEKEQKSISRKMTQKVLSEAFEGLGVSEEQARSPIVQQRLMWFLVDNKRKKQVSINLKGEVLNLNPTNPNGHAITDLKIQNGKLVGGWQEYSVINSPKSTEFKGEVQFIPKTGLSVISDIDDTIKISEVLDKKALLKNTFIKPYRATEGFPEYYKRLAQQGAYFHYVSASPWQLSPSLKPFMAANYPKGTMTLRNFRIKDSSLLAFLKPSLDYKVKSIKNIIKRYPQHEFILIGDSGEHDPEVYAKIYDLFPNKIKSIQIRAIKGSDLSEARFSKTFKSIPKSLWQVLEKPPFN